MDNSYNSPVLVQRSSPPHALDPHTNSHTSSPTSTRLPESFGPSRLSRADPEEAAVQPIMSQARSAPPSRGEGPMAPSLGEEVLRTSSHQATANDSASESFEALVELGQHEERLVENAESAIPMGEADDLRDEEQASDGTNTVATPSETDTEESSSEENPVERISEDVFGGAVSDVSLPQPVPEAEPLTEDPDPPPPPPPPLEAPKLDIPEWVNVEDDPSIPDEEELKEIEASDSDVSALNIKHHEKFFFLDVDDPEQRPVKKIRLNWLIKGVRGTTDRPNYARVMNSPAAYIDGFYWHIKFFPRGNNSSALSAYIKCSRNPPPPTFDTAEGTFTVYQGPVDADLGEIVPEVEIKTPGSSNDIETARGAPAKPEDPAGKSENNSGQKVLAESSDEAPTLQSPETVDKSTEDDLDWRISAQLGMVIYNPSEPRTGHWMSSDHQFNKHNDDWGWTSFSGPWNEIHVRRRGQRRALLQNDSLALDAYIRVFEDPTQALWWHSAPESENQWDSKSLAGYFPMGTPPLYHSPGVAGITAYLLLAPFRKVLQSVDTSLWRKDSRVKPQPIICQLQLVLYLMRNMRRDENYVNVNPVLEALDNFGETYSDVTSFWEVFRRSIELELEANDPALEQISEIFDLQGDFVEKLAPSRTLKIPVLGVSNIQMGLDRSEALMGNKWSFPDFLPIMLDRQRFDEGTREWQVLYDRVEMEDEIDLSQYSDEQGKPAKYTLYGFVTQVGERTSGKYYSVLRPNGPGTKWLAFEDGDGNKVFSYTRHRIEKFEGLEVDDLKTFQGTHQIAYMTMYIRTDRLREYLPGALEPYDMPHWLKPYLTSRCNAEKEDIEMPNDTESEVSVEVYSSASVKGRNGLLDMYNLKNVDKASDQFHALSLPVQTKFVEVRKELANRLHIDDVERIRLWIMQYNGLGEYTVASMDRVELAEEIRQLPKAPRPICLWMAILKGEEDINLYGYPDAIPGTDDAMEPLATIDAPAEAILRVSVSAGFDTGTGVEDRTQDTSETTEPIAAPIPNIGNGPVRATDAPGSAATSYRQVAGDMADESALVESAPDESQASVTAAVQATLASVTFPESGTDLIPFAVESSGLAPNEHGHTVDASNHAPALSTAFDSDPAMPIPIEVGETEALNDVAIATIVAVEVQGVEVMQPTIAPLPFATEGVEQSPSEPNEVGSIDEAASRIPDVDVDEADSGTSTPEDKPPRPVPHIYGFIQIFDVDKQDFVVKDTFFAERNADIKSTMKKCLGYDEDKEILVWQRNKVYHTTSVSTGTSFLDIEFKDGVDVIVGDVLPEEKKDELLAAGKFVTPSSLSHYIHMTARKHPHAITGRVTLSCFGGGCYSGPMLNGRYHGDDGVSITANGHTYKGPFVADEKSGKDGTMVYQNGDVYIGSWSKDEKHGQGTFVEKRTGNKYVGGFENGKRWGEGITYWKVADEQSDMCQICYCEEMDALFYDCGHVCACVECAKQCDCCPICRKGIQKVVKMYKA